MLVKWRISAAVVCVCVCVCVGGGGARRALASGARRASLILAAYYLGPDRGRMSTKQSHPRTTGTVRIPGWTETAVVLLLSISPVISSPLLCSPFIPVSSPLLSSPLLSSPLFSFPLISSRLLSSLLSSLSHPLHSSFISTFPPVSPSNASNACFFFPY